MRRKDIKFYTFPHFSPRFFCKKFSTVYKTLMSSELSLGLKVGWFSVGNNVGAKDFSPLH